MSLADFIEKNTPFSLPHYITHYVAGQTPISTDKAVGTALVSYLAIIFGLRELMKTREPLKLNVLFQLHNAILTLGSGLLLACMAEEVIPILWRTGLFNGICSEASWTPVRPVRLTSAIFGINMVCFTTLIHFGTCRGWSFTTLSTTLLSTSNFLTQFSSS